MARCVVEGSQTPCADLPTGARKTVEYTRGVRGRIRRGYYLLVSGPTEDETPEVERLDARLSMRLAVERNPELLARSVTEAVEIDPHTLTEVAVHDHDPGEPTPAEDPIPVPARNASRVKWAAFLTSVGVPFTDADGRDDLVALWDKADGVG